jgi:glucose-6-phosphate 1-dehydrogenase
MRTEQSGTDPRTSGGLDSEASDSKKTLLILGATGDLTARLLLPGLGALVASGGGEQLLLVGSATADWDDDHWRQRVADSFAAANARGTQVDAVVRDARYLEADVTVEADLRRLLDACQGRVAIFFALPPAVTLRACQALAGIELPEHTRLVLEKPFGTDAASAAALNDLLARLVPEDQVCRVDHYLGMSTVLNIVGLRFANRMIESVLNGEHVDSIDIVFDESLALEGRAGYYDRAGALVDMIQSHSLQVLALLAMDAPSTLQARDVRDATTAVLRATRVWVTTQPPGAAGPGTPPGKSTGGRCRRTWTRTVSTLTATPRRSLRWSWPSIPGGGPGCRSGCGPARRCAACARRR